MQKGLDEVTKIVGNNPAGTVEIFCSPVRNSQTNS